MSIPLEQVCLDSTKLSLKSGLAEVNIVHLDSGHGAVLWRPQERGNRRREKGNDCRPSGAQEFFQAHTFIGYIPSVTAFRVTAFRLELAVVELAVGRNWYFEKVAF
jgi:hypothetical protein